jgi:translation initiation factor IF-2
VTEEDVQKQVKETLARLTKKGNKFNNSAKYRRGKRDMVQERHDEEVQRQEEANKVLKVTEYVTANEIANMMNVGVTEIISSCMSLGMFVSINQRLDAETISLIASEFDHEVELVSVEVAGAVEE